MIRFVSASPFDDEVGVGSRLEGGIVESKLCEGELKDFPMIHEKFL
jgi:hypothetical protein